MQFINSIVYVVFKAPNDYAAACFDQYGLVTDSSGQYAAMYKPFHLIGLELNISILSAVLRGEATGQTESFRADVIATAKRPLQAGERLDGEGGYTVWGKLAPAEESLIMRALPIGLAHDVVLRNPIAAGQPVRWQDVDISDSLESARARKEMEERFRRQYHIAA